MSKLSKDEKWLAWALSGARLFSTCEKRTYMAIVTDPRGRVVGTGYNGSPPGQPHCGELPCPRLENGSPRGTSYEDCIAIHAEANALIHSDVTARSEGTMYISGQPCWDCAKLIAGSGLRHVVHVAEWVSSEEEYLRVLDVLMKSDVGIKEYWRQEGGPPPWVLS